MLSRLALAFACLAAAIGIAACGSDDTVGGAREGDVQVAESGPVEGEFTVSNWPGYIDPGKDGSVAEFEERTGVSVKYIEDINSNRPVLRQAASRCSGPGRVRRTAT